MQFTSATNLDVLVEVRHTDGDFYPGFLEHWRRREHRWQGWVRYTVGVGQQHLGWVDQDNLRQPPTTR